MSSGMRKRSIMWKLLVFESGWKEHWQQVDKKTAIQVRVGMGRVFLFLFQLMFRFNFS